MTKEELREFYELHGIYSLTDDDLEFLLSFSRRKEKKEKNRKKHVPLENDTD